MTYPYPFIYFNFWSSYPFIFLEPGKRYPFWEEPPCICHYRGYPFSPPPPGTNVTQQPTAIHVTATYFTSLLGGFKASSIISLSDIRACKWVKTSFASKIKKKITPLNSFQQYRQILFMLTVHVLKVAWECWGYSQ